MNGANSSLQLNVFKAGRYKLEVWGARGGDAIPDPPYTNRSPKYGGFGGYSVGVVRLEVNDTLYLYAGGRGASVDGTTVYSVTPEANNGGGPAIGPSAVADRTAGSGGGGTDVRIGEDSLYHRVIVAGGGGGASTTAGNASSGSGGYGGGSEGQDERGTDTWRGGGGTQSAGGAGSVGYSYSSNSKGVFGKGGYYTTGRTAGVLAFAGGGGGWYGGGGGYSSKSTSPRYATGGGSGWIYTQASYNAWSNAADKNIWNASGLGSLKDSGGALRYLLEDTGLEAAQTLNGGEQIPNPLDTLYNPDDPWTYGPTITGNPNGGFIRITYLGS
jgi:hypothetical protein